ncbi:hypothetical protein ACSNN9_13240 [Micromonospora sp. URMC 107]|uniref:hypothetical protein n=1 Tax=Micromonospora sp. URMC 107 TaxID=3423418 RepID=UPI003F1AB135
MTNPKMRRRKAPRADVEAVPVVRHGDALAADFRPADYVTPPAAGWTAATLWAAAWAYAVIHGDDARGDARVALRAFARAYDRARHLEPSSTHAVVRQDVEARLRGVDYAESRPEKADP